MHRTALDDPPFPRCSRRNTQARVYAVCGIWSPPSASALRRRTLGLLARSAYSRSAPRPISFRLPLARLVRSPSVGIGQGNSVWGMRQADRVRAGRVVDWGSGTAAADVEPSVDVSGYPRGTLDAVAEVLDALADARISYCAWKSNEHLDAALAGQTDLDLLVDRADAAVLADVFGRHDIKRILPPPDMCHPATEHFLGFDRPSGELFHLHVQYQLVLGQKYIKNYTIPLERQFLQSVSLLHGVPVPRPELELAVLATRALLKYRVRDVVKDVLRIRSPGVPAETRQEIEWLEARTTIARVRVASRRTPRRPPARSDLHVPRTTRDRAPVRPPVPAASFPTPPRVAPLPTTSLRSCAARLRAGRLASATAPFDPPARCPHGAAERRCNDRARWFGRVRQVDDGRCSGRLVGMEAPDRCPLHGEQGSLATQSLALRRFPGAPAHPSGNGRPTRTGLATSASGGRGTRRSPCLALPLHRPRSGASLSARTRRRPSRAGRHLRSISAGEFEQPARRPPARRAADRERVAADRPGAWRGSWRRWRNDSTNSSGSRTISSC